MGRDSQVGRQEGGGGREGFVGYGARRRESLPSSGASGGDTDRYSRSPTQAVMKDRYLQDLSFLFIFRCPGGAVSW